MVVLVPMRAGGAYFREERIVYASATHTPFREDY